MKIYLGADHNGFHIKKKLRDYLIASGYDVEDDGNDSYSPEDDYPIFASKVVHAMRKSQDADPRGILICGSGQGMCIAANRYKGIRACLGYDRLSVRSARNDDDSNVLCLPSNLSKDDYSIISEAWLNTAFAGAPRFIRRNREIDEISSL